MTSFLRFRRRGPRHVVRHRELLLAVIVAAGACAPGLPRGATTAPSPSSTWTPPLSQRQPAPDRIAPDSLPHGLEARRTQLSTADLVTLALERSPETRTTWLQAEAAVASYGEARGAYYPQIIGDVTANRLKTAATGGRVSVEQTTYGPSLTLNWLLFDFGGRSGAVDAAHSALYASDWTHNAMVVDVVRRTEQGYYAYVGARGLAEAERVTLEEAQVNLSAADERRTVGVATIADVLQARTAVAQARLDLQTAEGALASAHGALATLIGLPPSASFEVDTSAANAPIANLSEAVDSLIARALADRPDLAAQRALVDERRAEARSTAAQRKPSLAATGTAGTTYLGNASGGFPSYNFGFSLAIPLFNGFGWEYAARAASLTADAEAARLRDLEQQVALQVFQTYQELRTATLRVAASDDLFTSASANADAARGRYRAGVGSLLELLTAEQALATARAERVQARVEWHTSLVQLAHDAGVLDPNGTSRLHLTPVPPPPAPGSGQ